MAEGQWLGHAEGLPDGFWLGLQHKSCPTFMQHNSQTISTNPLPSAQNRHLIYQALFVGLTITRAGNSLWQRDNGWKMQSVRPQWVLAWTSANLVQLLCKAT
jgi:hypothetical protein